MVRNVFVRHWVALFRRAFQETDIHYRNNLSCHHLQRSMERFTNTELTDMHLIYGLVEGNARAAERLYCERYLKRDVLCDTPSSCLGEQSLHLRDLDLWEARIDHSS
ncbi:hypothetical protein TNCV_671561 [Trichonephila clavipes]|nr:hypothetical protein TNCV_671561 [Trichonephila clavipes]